MVEYDLNELAAGTVDSITGKFGELSDDQLATLRGIEAKGPNKRATLLKAIDTEIAQRAEAGKASEGAAGEGDGVTSSTSAIDAAFAAVAKVEGDDGGAGQSAGKDGGAPSAIYTQADMDQALATQKATLDADHELKLRNAVAAATRSAPKDAKPAKVKPLAPLAIDPKAGKVADVPDSVAVQVVFVGLNDVPLGSLTPMTFAGDDFTAGVAGAVIVLQRDVEFPVAMSATEVLAAFVTNEDGKPVGRASLVMPFGIGGGRQAKLPAGTLVFE